MVVVRCRLTVHLLSWLRGLLLVTCSEQNECLLITCRLSSRDGAAGVAAMLAAKRAAQLAAQLDGQLARIRHVGTPMPQREEPQPEARTPFRIGSLAEWIAGRRYQGIPDDP